MEYLVASQGFEDVVVSMACRGTNIQPAPRARTDGCKMAHRVALSHSDGDGLFFMGLVRAREVGGE